MARLHLRPSYPKVSWGPWISDYSISVRRSLLVLRIFHSRIPMASLLRNYGVHGRLICCFCGSVEENLDNLFWDCPKVV